MYAFKLSFLLSCKIFLLLSLSYFFFFEYKIKLKQKNYFLLFFSSRCVLIFFSEKSSSFRFPLSFSLMKKIQFSPALLLNFFFILLFECFFNIFLFALLLNSKTPKSVAKIFNFMLCVFFGFF